MCSFLSVHRAISLPYKIPQHPDLLTHHFYLWLLVTSSVEYPPLSEPQCLTTQALPPFLLPSLALLLQEAPYRSYSLWNRAPMLWFTLYGSTSHTRLLIVLVSFPVAVIKYSRQELIILDYNPSSLWGNQGSKNLKYIHSQRQPENESTHASQCSVNSLLVTQSRAQPIQIVPHIQDIGLRTSGNSSNNPSQAKLDNCSLGLPSQVIPIVSNCQPKLTVTLLFKLSLPLQQQTL